MLLTNIILRRFLETNYKGPDESQISTNLEEKLFCLWQHEEPVDVESQGFGILQKSGKLKKETNIFLEGHERKIYVSSEYYNKKEEKQEKNIRK